MSQPGKKQLERKTIDRDKKILHGWPKKIKLVGKNSTWSNILKPLPS